MALVYSGDMEPSCGHFPGQAGSCSQDPRRGRPPQGHLRVLHLLWARPSASCQHVTAQSPPNWCSTYRPVLWKFHDHCPYMAPFPWGATALTSNVSALGPVSFPCLLPCPPPGWHCPSSLCGLTISMYTATTYIVFSIHQSHSSRKYIYMYIYIHIHTDTHFTYVCVYISH